ncbi:hypothetical protein BS329_30520 [Amycolatopsis coloradensis]|uniref:Uncharacterized protein n=1 Tax=Amycolatopsis coloradensis TaxID=76021 RepID=A0A1R0KKC2_9PSEU|nr:hypothetical protein [Amycolatopsis coloradensis]OLZ46559.1 hypothetical protein BS329_30520 [Amycolatopsis coloradensis]
MPRTGKTARQRRAEQATGLYLRELLTEPGPARDQWEEVADEIKPGDITQSAICQVLALHMWDQAIEPETDQSLPRRLKDPVSKALRGLGFSPRLLRCFLGAFMFSDKAVTHVRALYRGDQRPAVIVGTLPSPEQMPEYRAHDYDTLKLQEHHWLGADGLPSRHRTEIMIRARVDGLSVYQYRIDTPHARVRSVRGGEGGVLHQLGPGIWAVDLKFPHALKAGEDHYIEFWTLLKYDVAPPPEMRRGSHERVEHLDIRVEFHPEKLPSGAFWGEWAHYTGPGNKLIDRDEHALDEHSAVHRYVEAIERTVVGFYWEW